MKPLFVSSRNGVRTIHWAKLFVYAVVLTLVAAVVAEGLSYLFVGTFGMAALVLAAMAVILSLVRIVVRTLAYQPAEFEEAPSS
jgi:hypothetical protein